MAQFSLSWDAHKTNICAGLSALQQNGEFVDMSLAADGHFVKVHQMVLSLASPYIKDIISSTQCQHPVIFLNKISYATLCAILEYIYTGEVLVAQENLNELIEASKELHIKGLQDMDVEIIAKSGIDGSQVAGHNEGHQLVTSSHKDPADVADQTPISSAKLKQNETEEYESETNNFSDDMVNDADDFMDTTDNHSTENVTSLPVGKDETHVQYTLSNRRALQLILNRYLYLLSYTSTRDRRVKRWNCADTRHRRCPAMVFTKDDVVIQRRGAHNHPFHDKRILKKIRDKAVFSTIVEAESVKLKDTKQDK